MASTDAAIPSRLVICVDGSQYNRSSGNETSIHRIYSSIKSGKCTDGSTGGIIKQLPHYILGIGSADETFSKDRIQASVFGQGHLKQIQDVYEKCCQLRDDKDEIWLFGFSRGAYVVRAVAGLLHQFVSIPNSVASPRPFPSYLQPEYDTWTQI